MIIPKTNKVGITVQPPDGEPVSGHARVSIAGNSIHRIINPSLGNVATFHGVPSGETDVTVSFSGGGSYSQKLSIPASGDFAATMAVAASAAADNLRLLKNFAPLVRLHPNDDYRPSSVGWYLKRVIMRLDRRVWADRQILDKGEVRPANIAKQSSDGQSSGGRSKSSFFLQIPNDDDEQATRRGSLASAVCYARIIERKHHKDLQYWFFYPYNGLSLGEHEGDWEHISIRVAEGKAVKYYFATHGDGQERYPRDVDLVGRHVVVYSARHSHASYPTAKTHVRSLAPDDHTANGGPEWRTWRRLKTIDRRLGWVRYSGHWGEIGDLPWTSGPHGPAHQSPWSGDAF